MALHASRRHVLMAGMCIVLLFVVEVEVAAVGNVRLVVLVAECTAVGYTRTSQHTKISHNLYCA